VNVRVTALLFAFGAIVLTLAQDVYPAREWYHGWQYITILALAIGVLASAAWSARREGPGARRFALALVGALLVAVAGLLSALIGPDTVSVVGTPGTVTPVPELGAAAFFGAADATTIGRGDASVILRRRGAPEIDVGRRPLPLDLAVVVAEPHPSAYVVVRDANGNRLTVTQPNNPSFLSPVLVFRQTQAIREHVFPFDTFAVPSLHRVVHALYFSAADLAAFRPNDAPGAGGIVVSVSDDRGSQLGLTLAPSGREVTIAGLHITMTMGTYPILIAASAPQPFVVIAGLVLFLGAGMWGLVRRRVVEGGADSTIVAPGQ
jgi:hypothetical protein